MIGIYKIENTKNNNVYIGQSTNIERRWSEHLGYLQTCNNYDILVV